VSVKSGEGQTHLNTLKETEKKQVLITVKAYPNPSRELGETVCCAGIDLSNNQLIRLYPIPFRDLDNNRKFKKYSIIEADCFRSSDDKRPESYSINCDSLRIIEAIDTQNGTWKKRKDIVLKAPIKSMCRVHADQLEKDLSLGIIKPENISFKYNKRKLGDPIERAAYYASLSFFNKQKDMIEEIPYQFYYDFKCADVDDCPGHKLSIIDWEIGQAYREWRDQYSKDEAVKKIEQKWLEISDTSKKDVYFYVGNMQRFRDIFMVLGVFYPKKLTSS
jgi:hypothetical protein